MIGEIFVAEENADFFNDCPGDIESRDIMEKCSLYISAVDYNANTKLIERVYACYIFGEIKMLMNRKEMYSLLESGKCTFFLDDRSYNFCIGIFNNKFIHTEMSSVAEDRLGFLLSIHNRLGKISDMEYLELQMTGEKFFRKQTSPK